MRQVFLQYQEPRYIALYIVLLNSTEKRKQKKEGTIVHTQLLLTYMLCMNRKTCSCIQNHLPYIDFICCSKNTNEIIFCSIILFSVVFVTLHKPFYYFLFLENYLFRNVLYIYIYIYIYIYN